MERRMDLDRLRDRMERNLVGLIADLEQMLRDIHSYNDNNAYGAVLDTESDRMLLVRAKASLKALRIGDMETVTNLCPQLLQYAKDAVESPG